MIIVQPRASWLVELKLRIQDVKTVRDAPTG
jgi:hypothetical protein